MWQEGLLWRWCYSLPLNCGWGQESAQSLSTPAPANYAFMFFPFICRNNAMLIQAWAGLLGSSDKKSYSIESHPALDSVFCLILYFFERNMWQQINEELCMSVIAKQILAMQGFFFFSKVSFTSKYIQEATMGSPVSALWCLPGRH